MLSSGARITLPRSDLAKVFGDPRTLSAFEAALATVQDTPDAVNAAQAAADLALTNAATALAAAIAAQGSATATQAALDALVAALGALAYLDTINDGNWLGADLSILNGGTGASTAGGARTNLGLVIGTDVQAFTAALSIYAGITPSANVQAILGAANYAAIRTLLGLGSLALLNTINGGNWSGTDLAVIDGGTGASTAAAARTNLDAARTAGASVTAATDTGYLFAPWNPQAGAYNLITPSDIGKCVYHTSATPHTWSLFTTGGLIPQGAMVELRNDPGGGTITISPQAGVTLYWVASGLGAGTFKIPANCAGYLKHIGSDVFQLEGFGITP